MLKIRLFQFENVGYGVLGRIGYLVNMNIFVFNHSVFAFVNETGTIILAIKWVLKTYAVLVLVMWEDPHVQLLHISVHI